jgi:hypothetical protein
MLEVELLADYLVENSYASTTLGAYNLIPCMSDNWMSLVLEELEDLILEMRKEDKVKGKTKTPLHKGSITIPGRVEKYRETPEGKIGMRVVPATQRKVQNPDAISGRRRQGMPAVPDTTKSGWVKNYNRFLIDRGREVRHPHGGGEWGVKPGSKRGVKKDRGAKPKVDPKTTPVGRFKEKKRQEAIGAAYEKVRPRNGYGGYGDR